MRDTDRSPLAAALLGYAGLLPFAATLLAAWTAGPWSSVAMEAFLAYAATILGFLGGVQWGLALTPSTTGFAARLTAGVLPPLAAWVALLLPPTAGTLLLAAGFAALLGWDRLRNADTTPDWYLPLRTRLSLAVIGCHLLILPVTLW